MERTPNFRYNAFTGLESVLRTNLILIRGGNKHGSRTLTSEKRFLLRRSQL